MRNNLYHPDTEVATLSSWKSMRDITPGEDVIQYNPLTTGLDSAKVTTTERVYFKGGMIRLFYNNHNCQVTRYSELLVMTEDNRIVKRKAYKLAGSNYALPFIAVNPEDKQLMLSWVQATDFTMEPVDFEGYLYSLDVPSGVILTKLHGGMFLLGNYNYKNLTS